MPKTVKVIFKNAVEFEVHDSISTWDEEQFIALAKKAFMQTPQSILLNDAKIKIKK